MQYRVYGLDKPIRKINLIKQIIVLFLLLTLNFSSMLQAQEEVLLPPEEAFSLSAWMEDEEIRNRRVVGEMSGEEFAAHINVTFQ